MKTMQLIAVAHASDTALVVSRSQQILAETPKMPRKALNEALFQYCIENFLIGCYGDDAGYGYYENSESVGRKVENFDPIGTVGIRVDFDPMFNPTDDEGSLPMKDWEDSDIFDMAMMIVRNPYDPERNPHSAGIYSIRISAVINIGKVMTRTIFPTSYRCVSQR